MGFEHAEGSLCSRLFLYLESMHLAVVFLSFCNECSFNCYTGWLMKMKLSSGKNKQKKWEKVREEALVRKETTVLVTGQRLYFLYISEIYINASY